MNQFCAIGEQLVEEFNSFMYK